MTAFRGITLACFMDPILDRQLHGALPVRGSCCQPRISPTSPARPGRAKLTHVALTLRCVSSHQALDAPSAPDSLDQAMMTL